MKEILSNLGLEEQNFGGFNGEWLGSGPELQVTSPIDGSILGTVKQVTEEEYDTVVDRAHEAFLHWRTVPAPHRGELMRLIGNRLRERKSELGALVTLEMGKIRAEGEGEVQEMIDICDFATGLSRQLYGLTIASERQDHRMMEQWHPLGVRGRDQCLQLSGRRVELERGAWVRMWRLGLVEAGQPDAAHGDRCHQDLSDGMRGAWRGSCHLLAHRREGVHHRGSTPARSPDPARVPPRGAAPSDTGWVRWWASGWVVRSSSWAVTTPSSSLRTPTWTWRCPRSSSARWERPDSDARARAGSSSTHRYVTSWWNASREPTRVSGLETRSSPTRSWVRS